MEVRIVQQESEFESLAADWDRLAGVNTFCRHGWLSVWWKFYGRGNQLLVLVAEEDDRIVGIAPFYRTFSVATGKCIRFLGSNEVCSDYLKILIDGENADESHDAGLEQRVVVAFAKALQQANRNRSTCWDMLELTGGKRDEPVNALFCAAMQEIGNQVHHHTIESSWALPLPKTWDELNAKHGQSFRRTLKKIDKELIQTERVKCFEATDSGTFEHGFEILVDLHQRRRAVLDEPGCFADPRFTGFLKTFARDALQRGELLLQWMELESEPLSVAICFLHAGVVSMYQSGVNPELMKHRPGHLQNMVMLKNAISRGFTHYDFLRGDEPYKQLWRAAPTELVTTRIISGRIIPLLRHQAWAARQTISSWMHSDQ